MRDAQEIILAVVIFFIVVWLTILTIKGWITVFDIDDSPRPCVIMQVDTTSVGTINDESFEGVSIMWPFSILSRDEAKRQTTYGRICTTYVPATIAGDTVKQNNRKDTK